jgi:quinol monooxygenase YgiN
MMWAWLHNSTPETVMMYVLARITVKSEAADSARTILTRLAQQSRQEEPGCESYEVFVQADTPHVFQTVERWRDQAAFDGHMRSAHVGAALAAAGPLLAGPPEIKAYDKLT